MRYETLQEHLPHSEGASRVTIWLDWTPAIPSDRALALQTQLHKDADALRVAVTISSLRTWADAPAVEREECGVHMLGDVLGYWRRPTSDLATLVGLVHAAGAKVVTGYCLPTGWRCPAKDGEEERCELDGPGACRVTPDRAVYFRAKAERTEPQGLAAYDFSELRRAAARQHLERAGGNRKAAAQSLGIGERTLYRWLEELGL